MNRPKMDYADMVNKMHGRETMGMGGVPSMFKRHRKGVLGAALIAGGLGAGALGLRTMGKKQEPKKKNKAGRA